MKDVNMFSNYRGDVSANTEGECAKKKSQLMEQSLRENDDELEMDRNQGKVQGKGKQQEALRQPAD